MNFIHPKDVSKRTNLLQMQQARSDFQLKSFVAMRRAFVGVKDKGYKEVRHCPLPLPSSIGWAEIVLGGCSTSTGWMHQLPQPSWFLSKEQSSAPNTQSSVPNTRTCLASHLDSNCSKTTTATVGNYGQVTQVWDREE